MKNINPYVLILFAVFFSMIAGAAIFFSYSTYTLSKELEKNYKQSLGRLEQEIAELKAQLATIQVQAEVDSTQRVSKIENALTPKSSANPLVSQHEAVKRLEKIVETSGLEQLAANEDMDPTLLSEMYTEFADRRQTVIQQEQLLQINTELHKTDEDRYGPELMALYERARLRRRDDTDRQESDRAFAELLAKYPEAYATGMAIAERALFSSFRRNTSEVEKYYNMLRDNENFSNVVTDRGVEAVPNIEYYLARQYLRQGSIDNALALIESLEKNYPDSLLFTRRSGSGRRWQTVSQVIPRLRQDAETLR
ncbi:MAG: tetratricopeptide repeat protein [Desulfobacterales bacterium]|nr:MAG: tetratricopeptide repeat protein [Desulfobacterales bacterium]